MPNDDMLGLVLKSIMDNHSELVDKMDEANKQINERLNKREERIDARCEAREKRLFDLEFYEKVKTATLEEERRLFERSIKKTALRFQIISVVIATGSVLAFIISKIEGW